MDRNEAIRIVRMCCPKIANSKCDFETAMRVLIPELKESEDEMIREQILDYFMAKKVNESQPVLDSWIAWLEKQGEHKPAWSEEDEIGCCDAMWAIEQARTIAKNENEMGNLWYAERWLKSIKERVQPLLKYEWSEEDENKKNDAITAIDLMMTDSFKETHPNLYKAFGEAKDWLKSLKERYAWKPSDEQMQALANALGLANNCGEDSAYYLRTLHDTLKRLRYEKI